MGTSWASRALVHAEAMEHGIALDAFDDAAVIYRRLPSACDRDLLLAGLWLSRGLTLAATGRQEDALQPKFEPCASVCRGDAAAPAAATATGRAAAEQGPRRPGPRVEVVLAYQVGFWML